MDFTYERLNSMLEELKGHLLTHQVPVEGFLYKETGYKQGTALPVPDEGWEVFGPRRLWGGEKDGHAWFFKRVEIPAELRGAPVELRVLTGAEGGWDATNPQFMAYLDGHPAQGLDVNHTALALPGAEACEVLLYAYAGMVGQPLRFEATLQVTDPLFEKLYYHLYVPHGVLGYLEPDSAAYIDLCGRVNAAIDLIDLRDPGSDACRASLQAAIDELEQNLYTGGGMDGAKVAAIGHTHIDVAWLWTLAQTREKTQRSFATMLRLMERYPEFIFMSSQAQLYQYLKEESPELYAQVKQMVAAGRWEVEGAMWVEADCNLSSGESLVRQIIHGKRFFMQEFGVDSKVLWLPDVFGYSAALPQILRKSGVEAFVTSKISWNESNTMPVDTFDWQGIDGSRVFTYFLTAQDKIRGKKPVNFTTYNATTEPAQIAGTWERYHQKDLSKQTLLTFGYGDGGGGPTPHEIELLRRTQLGLAGCPATEITPAGQFLAEVRQSTEGKRPVWAGELYLEYHRGTYTSNAKNKQNNRTCEFLYQNAELWSLAAGLLAGAAYPKQALQQGWEGILLHQFHDIIPGSSIKEVYDDSDVAYAALLKDGRAMEQAAYTAIAERVATEGGLLVFNPHSFVNSGVVQAEGESVFVRDVPAKGYKVVAPERAAARVKAGEKTLENDFFALEFDEKGAITSLVDKRCGRQVLAGRGNVLEAYEDIPRAYDAWEISAYYRDKRWEIDAVTSMAPMADGCRAGLRIEYAFLDSTLAQTIWLYDDLPKIDFETDIDWKQSHILVKAAFPVAVHATKASYEIQFGSVERPTHSNTSWDAAMFEVCAQKYADLSEHGYGVALLNDCKYGHDIHDGVMRLTLLKSPTYPSPVADKHRHHFTYSLCPHQGDYRTAGVIEMAYDLNKPMAALPIGRQAGSLPESWGLVACDEPAVIIETAKQAEAGGEVVLRMYEAHGGRAKATLTLGFDARAATLCDLLENDIKPLELQGRSLTLELAPYEIATVKLSL